MKPSICLLLLLLFSFWGNAQHYNLIPYPNSMQSSTGFNTLKNNAAIAASDPQFADLLVFANTRLQKFSKTGRLSGKNMVDLQIDATVGAPQAYVLNTTNKIISIKASAREGLFNGLATLLQLVNSAKVKGTNVLLPKLIVTDAPRYAWRGIMLDESRHFFGAGEVKKLLDWMAFYKLNRLHWHLTDANGWRIEIKKYPKLTTVGGRGNFSDSLAPVKYYTQTEVKQIVAYAAARNITIIPEIDMPGHASAANRAYPEYSGGNTKGFENFTFDPSKDATYSFLTDILRELSTLFKSRMIHIGGDEVALGIKAWQNNPGIISFMQQQGYTTPQQLERYFIRRMADSVAKLNSRVFCWDEVADNNLSVTNTTINWWRHNKPEVLTDVVNRGYQTILCPRLPLYFDFVQDSTHVSGRKWLKLYNSLSSVYQFPENTVKTQLLASPNIIGLQANLWTETVASAKRLNYLFFPRIAAVAEAGWTQAGNKNEQLFGAVLKSNFKLFDQDHIYYYNPFSPDKTKEAIDIKPKVIGLD